MTTLLQTSEIRIIEIESSSITIITQLVKIPYMGEMVLE